MHKSGPPPLPSSLKKMRGTFRRDRVARNELDVPEGTPDMPNWLDKEARAEWQRVVPILQELRVLTLLDRGLLANYCAAWWLCVQATRLYVREGLAPKAKRGSKMARPHPMVKVATEARAQALRLAAEFGLTPSSRSRVSTAEPGAAIGDESAARFLFELPDKDKRGDA
jgi:P27 family predicted phage terminase small subunit